MSSLRSLSGQVQVALGGEEFLHQAVGRSEDDGVAGFSPDSVALGRTERGSIGRLQGSPKACTLTPRSTKHALGQVVQLLPQCQGDTVMLEGLPSQAGRKSVGVARRSRLTALEAGGPRLPAPAPARKMGMALPWPSGGETSHRLGAHRGQLELDAQLAVCCS